jgi:hypothetical protein
MRSGGNRYDELPKPEIWVLFPGFSDGFEDEGDSCWITHVEPLVLAVKKVRSKLPQGENLGGSTYLTNRWSEVILLISRQHQGLHLIDSLFHEIFHVYGSSHTQERCNLPHKSGSSLL